MWFQNYIWSIPSKLYFCADKLRFPTKSVLANLESWGFFTSQLGKRLDNMDNKTKRLWVRLSPEDERLFKEKASKYHSVSAMVRDAVRQFNDIATVGKIDALNDMVSLYRKYQQELGWLGGNFNQAMKRANELAIGGLLDKLYYERVILPQCNKILDFLEDIKREQHAIAKKIVKL